MPKQGSIKIGGERVTFLFDYDRLEQLRPVFGDASAEAYIGKIADTADVTALVKVASVASVPFIAEETIRRESPPIVALSFALIAALREAYFGRGLQHDDEQRPREAANPPKRRATGSRRRTTQPSMPASERPSSGA